MRETELHLKQWASSETDSEPEQTQNPTAALKKSQPQSSSKPQQPPFSPDEEESENTNGGPRKLGSKPSASEPATLTESTGSKRLAEEKELEAKGAKRSKKKPEPEPEIELENSEKKSNDDCKEQLLQRLWSEDDEL
ncbi:hypothetical protein Salat_2554000 [Sesamum alatum]|uniref:Uncharacterized protein n=1 Tax=Sesamum alatum TaxID=300844 RepID=A0AAE1XTI6_9LAMI|nr:hypothetical protein Salat_2554000 [Sesamum alatum]